MTNLTILNTSIRSLDNLYSLNDLHRVSGGEMKHQPSNFIRLDTIQGLIREIEKNRSSDLMIAHKTVRGGRNPALQGTWACKELVIAYAAWISPTFHLVVLRAFLNQMEQPKQLALPEPKRMVQIEEDVLEVVLKHCNLSRKLAEKTEAFHRNLFEQLGLNSYHHNEIAAMSHDVTYEFNHWIRKAEEVLYQSKRAKLPSVTF